MSDKPVYIQLFRPNNTKIDSNSKVKVYSTGALGGGLSEETSVGEQGLVYLPAEWRGRTITSLFVTEDKQTWQLKEKKTISKFQDSNDPIKVSVKK